MRIVSCFQTHFDAVCLLSDAAPMYYHFSGSSRPTHHLSLGLAQGLQVRCFHFLPCRCLGKRLLRFDGNRTGSEGSPSRIHSRHASLTGPSSTDKFHLELCCFQNERYGHEATSSAIFWAALVVLTVIVSRPVRLTERRRDLGAAAACVDV